RCVSSAPLASTKQPQQANDALHQRISRLRKEIVQGGALSDLRACRVRQYHSAKRPDVELFADRKAPRADEVACLGAHNGRTENSAPRRGDHLDMTAGLALRLGPIVFAVRPAQHPNGPALPSLALGIAGLGQLRVSENDARQELSVLAYRQAKERVPDHQAGVVVGDVGELCSSGNVANGIDALVRST